MFSRVITQVYTIYIHIQRNMRLEIEETKNKETINFYPRIWLRKQLMKRAVEIISYSLMNL